MCDLNPEGNRATHIEMVQPGTLLELATNFRLLVLSILHSHKRIIKQSSQSHWVAAYNLKVSSARDL